MNIIPIQIIGIGWALLIIDFCIKVIKGVNIYSESFRLDDPKFPIILTCRRQIETQMYTDFGIRIPYIVAYYPSNRIKIYIK